MAWLRALLPRRSRRNDLRDAALRYARLGWLVVPGSYVIHDVQPHGRHAKARPTGSAPPRCSCRHPRCPAPGEHPAAPDWQIQATHDARIVGSWWTGRESPNVVLPTGWTFDALGLPPRLGARLFARFRELNESRVGPVARGKDGQWWFFTAPAVEADRPHAEWLATVGVGYHGVGHYLIAPPSTGGVSGGVGWVNGPSKQARRMPSVEACARLLVDVVAPRYGAVAPRPTAIEESSGLWTPRALPSAPAAPSLSPSPSPRPRTAQWHPGDVPWVRGDEPAPQSPPRRKWA